MQIDLACVKCKREIKTKVLKKGLLLCECPTCKYMFRMEISNAQEFEIGF